MTETHLKEVGVCTQPIQINHFLPQEVPEAREASVSFVCNQMMHRPYFFCESTIPFYIAY